MFSQSREGPSPIVLGVVIGLLLILIISMRSCSSDGSQALKSRFAQSEAASATQAASGTPFIPVPEPVQSFGATAIAKLRGGEAVVPATPVATNDVLEVRIQSLQQVEAGLQIKGLVTNTGKVDLRVPLAAFQFIDQQGTVYAAQGDAAANLPPNGSTTLDLTLPIQDPTALQMVVDLPEANVHLEIQLLGEGS